MFDQNGSTDILSQMKGVVLAGGLGAPSLPLTKITNKHLLKVYDRPTAYHPIEELRLRS